MDAAGVGAKWTAGATRETPLMWRLQSYRPALDTEKIPHVPGLHSLFSLLPSPWLPGENVPLAEQSHGLDTIRGREWLGNGGSLFLSSFPQAPQRRNVHWPTADKDLSHQGVRCPWYASNPWKDKAQDKGKSWVWAELFTLFSLTSCLSVSSADWKL